MKILLLWVLIIILCPGFAQYPESTPTTNHHRNVSTNRDIKQISFVNISNRSLRKRLNTDGKYQFERQIKSLMVVAPNMSYITREKRDSLDYPIVQFPNNNPVEVCHICFYLFASPMFYQLIRKISKLAHI